MRSCAECRAGLRAANKRNYAKKKQSKEAIEKMETKRVSSDATVVDVQVDWYVVIDQDMKIVYRGIDLETACGKIEKGRLYGVGPTKDAAEDAARKRMMEWLKVDRQIQLAKAGS